MVNTDTIFEHGFTPYSSKKLKHFFFQRLNEKTYHPYLTKMFIGLFIYRPLQISMMISMVISQDYVVKINVTSASPQETLVSIGR